MFRFEKLEIWKEAIDFSKEIYDITQTLPSTERFALGDQLRRAVVSISANIAEGSGSSSDKDFRNYLSIAIKSVFEVVSLLALAHKNQYISLHIFTDLRGKAEILAKRIQRFRYSLRTP